MKYRKGRWSKSIKPLMAFADLTILICGVFLFEIQLSNYYSFIVYISIAWIIISLKNGFYEVDRQARVIQLFSLLFRQIVLFVIVLYAYMGFFKQPNVGRLALANYVVYVTVVVFSFKYLVFFLLKKFRVLLKGNGRTVIVIGDNSKTRQLIKIFKSKKEYGFDFKAKFSVKAQDFSIAKCLDYVVENGIDEIYFSVAELSNEEIKQLVDFSDNNLRTLKFIPDNKDIFAKNLKYEYYDYIPILSLRNIAVHEPINAFIKRSFDIVFSSLVILFVLSWLTPLMAILIKLESKGPTLFLQKRHGLDNREFFCFKYRSMAINKSTDDLHVKKNDMRVTKIGKFIRKTSLDEMPQFYNVFSGQMSVVGPRPHMISLSEVYMKKANRYMLRHSVKPGITGLAQVSGFRGEVEEDSDIINRVKYDIFYLENWSLLMDLGIILQTVLNLFKGEEKAY
ncbi:exopolysaccharide biosynthesis polyprenyl glycosylphosphotransferase [Maribacter luteus]|uniref:Exopolysaccharide biosynthesis polyprenyl glycosylphosphotransferase n=1 Tax=Maribacter luteus TaxID=2594478 RepID=A0A6I2MKF0_9FLAO|nr:exopolysaccharide biosynthesis polyprenyl glycosylphosphotransferase [Maribacter luteus]MRX64301.1 exopolysaccharide biosynthesis polyprenyl glycosylphosphotransferase [Maribacter luteus]